MAYTLFSTAIGWCGVGWNDRGLIAFQLPEATEAQSRARLSERMAEAAPAPVVPAWIQELIGRVQQHLRGAAQDFSSVAVDWTRVSAFQASVYREALKIRSGEKRSYGDIARAMGLGPAGARAVGVALGANPWPLIVPCHRVVSANDKMTGFSGPGGIRTKTRLLVLEGAELISE